MGNSKFMDGVLWGMLIGGVGVFLFGTKKGKKLLDIITQEGAEGLNKVISEIEEEMEDVSDESSPDAPKTDEELKVIAKDSKKETLPLYASQKPKIRRFFSSSRKSL